MRPGELINRILSASAGLMAVAALGTAVYSTWLTREQERMSVWPYVMQGNTYAEGHYRLFVMNAGLGPALVRSFEVRVDGRPRKNWGEVLRSLRVVPERGSVIYGDLGRGTVLLPGQSYSILEVKDTLVRPLLRARAERMTTIICYCSLYRECWLEDSREAEPRRGQCQLARPTDFAREHAGANITTRPVGSPLPDSLGPTEVVRPHQ
jgi:hypothetical protein